MTTVGNLFYYIRLILLTTLLLTVLSAYATPPSSEPAEPPLTVASVSETKQAGKLTMMNASAHQATVLTSEGASAAMPAEPATESSRFRETMRNFFGPNLNVKLRQ